MPGATASYYNNIAGPYRARLILSSVTLTIRYEDEQNQQQEMHWLGEKIISLEERVNDAELRYPGANGQPEERLIIHDQETIQGIKKQFAHQPFARTGRAPRPFRSGWSKLLLLLGFFGALLLAAYLWMIPWLGERVAMNFSRNYEVEIGEHLYSSTISQYTIDTHKTTQVNHFYGLLQYQTNYPVSITVVNAGTPNAFAIPGGHIVVFDAILEKMKTPEQLAALLGHEVSHIALRHSLRNIFRSLARKMFLSLLLGSESGITAVIVNNADALKGLEYSRELETEADENGMRLMSHNHIDPNGMLQLMELLQDATQGTGTVNFLSTHPVFDRRIDHIKAQLRTLQTPRETNDSLSSLFQQLQTSQRW
ncbi:MAG: M48 family metallopeptidase [Candidatus Pseudobacter hemicellulosilyticus]|uniref:M48 family metallopeptidase n=1 Tax=Candidatus Pseudobacter hemicellulosilyticus TaxID=3121375 RepID=A0AAJ5WYU8_9BACT|nr:MAG: M48 family metallopeptidase [Pseudobacter sp.]